jgi:hypothetical protein
MTNTPEPQDYFTQESANEHPNLDTIYAYTKDFLEKQNQGIDAVDRKIATIIGVSGILLRFTKDLTGTGILLAIKIVICVCVIYTIWVCVSGLNPKKIGQVVDPDELLETERYYDAEEICKLRIARAWRDTANELEAQLSKKSNTVNKAITSLVSSIFLFGIHITIEDLIKPENMGWIQPVIQLFDRIAHSSKY